jgi:Flp pilus assembly protein TadD
LDEAEEAYRTSIGLDPGDSYPWVKLGTLYERRGNSDAAERAYSQAIELEPGGHALFHLGELLFGMGRFTEAENALRRASEADPTDLAAVRLLAKSLDALGRPGEAREMLDRFVELARTSKDWHVAGPMLETLERHDLAEEVYRRAVELDPNDDHRWVHLGMLLGNRGLQPEAESTFRKAIEVNARSLNAWLNLGVSLEKAGRLQEAEEAYQHAKDIDPRDPAPWERLGSLFERTDRLQDAEDALRRVTDLAPKNPESWAELGSLLVRRLKLVEAEDAIGRALAAKGKNVDTWNALGDLLQDRLRKYEEAETAYMGALAISPDDPHSLSNLAWLRLAQRRPDDAAALYATLHSRLEACGLALLGVGLEGVRGNFGEATSRLGVLLEADDPELVSTSFEDLLRVFRLMNDHGFGERLLEWLDSNTYGERFAPLRAAYDAFLNGGTRLRNVNPEVRRAAEAIGQWLGTPTGIGTARGKGKRVAKSRVKRPRM